jgi:hypothetical protein
LSPYADLFNGYFTTLIGSFKFISTGQKKSDPSILRDMLFQKIGFLSWCRCQKKNPIFSKNRIFKLVSVSKKNPIFSKNRIFKLVSVSKKIRFFQKIGFLSWCRCQKNPIFSKSLSSRRRRELIEGSDF